MCSLSLPNKRKLFTDMLKKDNAAYKLSKLLLASYSSNVAEVEPPFGERRRMGSNTHTHEERVTSYCFSCLP